MPAWERRVDAAPQSGCSPLSIPAPPHNPGVHELPIPPLSSPEQESHVYREMPRSAAPRRMLVTVPSLLFPTDTVPHHADWSSIREHDSAPPPSSNERARQGSQAVWATPTPS